MPDLTELRREVEDLALQLVMADAGERPGGAPAEALATLERIAQLAAREHAADAVAAASALREALRSGGGVDERMARLEAALAAPAGAASPPPPPAALSQDPELVRDFIMESREHLAAIETQVLALERDPELAEALNAVFRGFHTIKGLAGFLELPDIQETAHETETALDQARNGLLRMTPAVIDVVLEAADDLRRRLSGVEGAMNGSPSAPPPRNEAMLARVRALTAAAPAEPEPQPAAQVPAAETAPAPQDAGLAQLAAAIERSRAPEAPPPPRAAAPAASPAEPAERQEQAMAVRVDTAKLDYLVDMAGEMVIAQSLVRLDPDMESVKSPRLQRNLAQLTRITAELQKTAMAMRLVPIGPLFRRMARMVRDLSRQMGKTVEMETQGDDIELDRNIVQELADPLMHMVRNAVDHGIETAEERLRAGKNPTARLLLRGRHHAGQVVIEIADDGRGLIRSKIAAKAIEKGIISSADGMSDSEVHNLIFQPGFTTAAQVTSVSGRGVGMDVVRRHIERLRGRVEIRSTPGQGSCFILKLPLTLAIIDGLVVKVGQERYIAPLFAVREVLRPTAETIWTVQQRAEMALIRGELLPVLRLYRRFGVTPRSEDPEQSVLLVTEVEGRRFGLLVDELIGKREVVIKTLGETFKNTVGVAGGAILGDGRVGLILDLERLFAGDADAARG
jgi:two-component system, chemotaxis family, sensor kinase CheA